jgi:hypothetical protein
LSDYTRGEENKIQYKQGLVIKADISITKMLLDMSHKSDNLLSGIPLKNKALTMSANSLSTGLST